MTIRWLVSSLTALILAGCSTGASIEEAEARLCRDIRYWDDELIYFLAEETDREALTSALQGFQDRLARDAVMFRDADREAVANRIDEWELAVGRVREQISNEDSEERRVQIMSEFLLGTEPQQVIDDVQASVVCPAEPDAGT